MTEVKYPNLPIPTLERQDFGTVPALTDEALFRETGVRIAFTGRAGGTSVGEFASLNTYDGIGDDPATVERNRSIALKALGVEADLLIVPNQVHGTDILQVPRSYDERLVRERAAAGVDAIAVEAERAAVLMNSADCLLLIVVSPTGRFVVAHAGWRGAIAGIAGKAARTLAALDGREGSAPIDGYNAYFGPHICSECFEVGEDVTAQFVATFGSEAVTTEGHVDLSYAITSDLMAAGLAQERIADSRICTKCNPEQYFSYRATNGRCGRHATIACKCTT